ncbi:MAG: RlpA-like double-psi beta-barrel domain-containing protein [Patescibacteria group bacterium]|nr:RlpA-like double-psi beta-barrel domain-containing protein [Patescibacteria group bacterium]
MIKGLKLLLTSFFLLLTFGVLPALAADGIVFDDGGVSGASVPLATQAKVVPLAQPATTTAASAAINTEAVSVSLDASSAIKGRALSTVDNNFSVSFPAKSLIGATEIQAQPVTDELPTPWKLEKISPTYQFDLSNNSAYNNKLPITLKLSYNSNDQYYKRIYFYDKNYQSWRELPTTDDPAKKTVAAKIFLPYAQVAVMSDPAVLIAGKASWYAYKNGNFAASIDFPKGSKLRVYNIDNNKSVDVTINDFGPERDKFPDRILDLDKVAFKKIAKAGSGIVSIRIQPLYVAPDANGRILGVSKTGAMSEPDIKAAAAIVIDEKTGGVIWEKNSSAVLPLASLSKLVAIKIFFDQHPSLNTVVTYKKQDELYNYQYCLPAESAKLSVNDGDTMTIGDLVYSALVGSANNAVESLVRVSGLSRDAFFAEMNAYVASIGATSTHFIEPTGLSPANVSTAREYAIIIREIFKNPVIQKISVAPRYSFVTINTKKKHTLTNTNNFIRDGVFAAVNNLKVTGSKTGYLDQYNLMTRVTGSAGEELIAVDFGATTKIQSLAETQELIQYGIRKLQ